MSVPPQPHARCHPSPCARRFEARADSPLRLASLIALVVLAVAACDNGAEDGLPPPPFDGEPARFFFPTGIAVTPDGEHLLVANSNFDRAFNSGTLLQIDLAAFDEAAGAADRRTDTLPAAQVVARGRIDSFAGPLASNAAGTSVWLATRNRDLLIRAPLDGGRLSCPNDDCSTDAIPLGPQGMDDPFSVVPAEVILPGGTAPEPVVVVNHLAPEGASDAEQSGWIAVIPERVASASQKPFENGAFRIRMGEYTTSALAWSDVTGRLFAGGCFLRVAGESVVACRVDFERAEASQNILRSVQLAAGPDAQPLTSQLGTLTGGRAETLDVALSSDRSLLYVATKTPNALLVVVPPEPGSTAIPTLRAVIPLASTPGRLHVIARPEGDLVAATALEDDALLLVEPAAGRVAAQVLPVGDGPYDVTSVETEDGHRLFVSLFFSCGVAAVDVPASRPFDAAVVSTVGACP